MPFFNLIWTGLIQSSTNNQKMNLNVFELDLIGFNLDSIGFDDIDLID